MVTARSAGYRPASIEVDASGGPAEVEMVLRYRC